MRRHPFVNLMCIAVAAAISLAGDAAESRTAPAPATALDGPADDGAAGVSPAFCLVGVEGVLTIRNFTEGSVPYNFRWDNDSEWKVYWLDSDYQNTLYISNGCGEITRWPQIEFDHSYEDGYQRRSYALEYTDQPESPFPDERPPGTLYNFETVGFGLDLFRDLDG